MARTFVSDTLAAIESGRLSAEEAVRAAVKGKRALEETVKRAQRRNLRRPAVFKCPTYPATVVAAALKRVQGILRGVSDVRSIHWGVCQRRGRRSAQTGVIVHVVRKLSARRLRKDRRRLIPASVALTHLRRRYVIAIDVQAVGRSATLQFDVLRPGHHGQIRVGQDGIGALGAIVAGPGGQAFALTAGHVARMIGQRDVQCADADVGVFPVGKVRCNQLSSGDDIAMIGPVPAVPPGATTNSTFARDAGSQDVHQRVFVLLPSFFSPIESHIEGVGVSAVFGSGAGLLSLGGLTSIDRVTGAGDSGSPALDAQGNVIGFVVGADATRTFLMPARRSLDALRNCQ